MQVTKAPMACYQSTRISYWSSSPSSRVSLLPWAMSFELLARPVWSNFTVLLCHWCPSEYFWWPLWVPHRLNAGYFLASPCFPAQFFPTQPAGQAIIDATDPDNILLGQEALKNYGWVQYHQVWRQVVLTPSIRKWFALVHHLAWIRTHCQRFGPYGHRWSTGHSHRIYLYLHRESSSQTSCWTDESGHSHPCYRACLAQLRNATTVNRRGGPSLQSSHPHCLTCSWSGSCL